MSAARQFAYRHAGPAPGRLSCRVSEFIADQAVLALLRELAAWPKPGLVSHVDSGSHTDMDAAMLEASAESLRPFFGELARAGQGGADMDRLRAIGLRAEAAMLAVTGGVNTHRGTIFGMGLLCAAAGKVTEISAESAAVSPVRLGDVVRRRWAAEIWRDPIPLFSHGAAALRRYGAGGARAEAASGFRSVYEVGWPALRQGRSLQPCDPSAPPVQACFALIAAVCDTNLLHRGGAGGMHYASEAASSFLLQGGVGGPDWRARAADVHAAFVARRLSPGGCADLLAMTLFVDALESEGAPQRSSRRDCDV
jgi:triphosphoribosyl-dephospho-CoA synthase